MTSIWANIKDRCKQPHQKGGVGMSRSALGKSPEDYINLYDQLKKELKQQGEAYESPEDHLNFLEKLELKKEQEAVEPTSERYQALKQAEEQGNAREELRHQQEELMKQKVKAQFNKLIEQPVMEGLAEHRSSTRIKLEPELASDLRTYYQKAPSNDYISAYTEAIELDLDILSLDYTPFIDSLYFLNRVDVLTISIKWHKSVDNS